jgi:hypothetical protein
VIKRLLTEPAGHWSLRGKSNRDSAFLLVESEASSTVLCLLLQPLSRDVWSRTKRVNGFLPPWIQAKETA